MLRMRSLVLGLLVAVAASCAAQQGLNNDSVIKLAKSGIGDDLVVATINAQSGTYSLATTDILALKSGGVSDKIIAAMIAKSAAPSVAASPSTAGNPVAGVDEVGVYYKDRTGAWAAMTPEIVNYKSGGALKSFASYGIVKQDKNGHIEGDSAKLSVAKPVNFLLYVPEGTAPAEYVLLKLRSSNGKSREFRSETGGVIHNSTGATRDNVEFTATKIAPRMYTFDLPQDTVPGQYGILPPGAVTSSNAASGGKIYTFKIIE